MALYPYIVAQPGSPKLRTEWGRQAALLAASRLARRTRRLTHIHAAVPVRGRLRRGSLLAIVGPTGAVEYKGPVGGLGSILTDMACSDTHIAQMWRERNNAAITAGTQAAIVATAVAGITGAVLKRPLLGALAGAALGWAGYAVWTAPYQIRN